MHCRFLRDVLLWRFVAGENRTASIYILVTSFIRFCVGLYTLRVEGSPRILTLKRVLSGLKASLYSFCRYGLHPKWVCGMKIVWLEPFCTTDGTACGICLNIILLFRSLCHLYTNRTLEMVGRASNQIKKPSIFILYLFLCVRGWWI